MTKKTIIVAGYGPGISRAVAERFGIEGFQVALVARNRARLEEGVASLAARGVHAIAIPADLADAAAVQHAIAEARAQLGPITALHWNAYSGGAGDLLAATPGELAGIFDVAIVGLVAAVQAALPGLRAARGAVLVTNGGLGLDSAELSAMAVTWNTMGLAVANAAKRKAVALLAARLAPDGVYVGEVTVLSLVKGTAFDQGSATLEPAAVAARFWDLHQQRTAISVQIG